MMVARPESHDVDNGGDFEASLMSGEGKPNVHVCIDLNDESHRSIVTARHVAGALNANMSLIHVIEQYNHGDSRPPDPVEWDMRRHAIESRMEELVDASGPEGFQADVHVLEGRTADQICGLLSERPEDIAVLYRSGNGNRCIGPTLHRVLEGGKNTLLIVPHSDATVQDHDFEEIVLALDGSAQAETAIPIALKLAESMKAELVLVHAIPETALTRAGPTEPRDQALLDEIRSRNMRVAKKYLDRQMDRFRAAGVKVKSLVLTGRDVRRALANSALTERTGLIILAAHGQSAFSDVALGDVANFVIRHAPIPVLLVRSGGASVASHAFSSVQSKGARPPSSVVS